MDVGSVATPDRPATGGPGLRRRLLLLFASPVALVAAIVIAWSLLPGPRRCIAPVGSCLGFHSGIVEVFGADNFTLAQTVVMAVGIWLSALLLALAALPKRVWVGAGFGVLVLAALVA